MRHNKEWFVNQLMNETAKNTLYYAIEYTIPYMGIGALVIPRQHMDAFLREFGTQSKITDADGLSKGGYNNNTPCLRINSGKPITRTTASLWAHVHDGAYLIDNLGGRGYTHNRLRADARAKGYPTAGQYYEILVAERLGLVNIGSNDRQSHTRHADNISANTGAQTECKLYTGFFALQYQRNWTWDND